MRRFVVGAAAVAALAFPSSSLAGTASVAGGQIVVYVAAAGETNRVTVAEDPLGMRIVDLGAPVVAGAGCTAVSTNEAVCRVQLVPRVRVEVGDLDDFVLVSGSADILVLGAAGDDVLDIGDPGAGVLIGGEGDDTLDGAAFIDYLRGGLGDDVLRGRGDDDRFRGGLGDDVLRGGPGTDRANYSERSAAVRVDLDGVADDGAPGEADTLISILEVVGGAGDDVLTGNAGFNALIGCGGADTLNGLGRFDVLSGDLGPPRTFMSCGVPFEVPGGSGDDTLNGGAGGDSLSGGPGEDTLNGGGAFDVLDGKSGDDALNGGAWGDSLSGGGGDDTLRGGPGRDSMLGHRGADTLFARDGQRDSVRGGTGTDRARVDRRLDTAVLIELFF
jgi:Ca2+-binding RTX toxin-like protein